MLTLYIGLSPLYENLAFRLGRGDRSRTGTLQAATDFKSGASTYSATPPYESEFIKGKLWTD